MENRKGDAYVIDAATAKRIALEAERPIIMDKIGEAAEHGKFSIIMDEISEATIKWLREQLGYTVETVYSGKLIRWRG